MTKSRPAPSAAEPGAAPTPPVDIEPLIAAGQRSLKATSEANIHMLKRMETLNAELASFIERRLEQDRETMRDLAACTAPPEALAVYGRFFERAMQQYSEEMGLLSGVLSDQVREAMEDMQRQVADAMQPAGRGGAGS